MSRTNRVRSAAFLIALAIGVAASSSHSGRSLALTNGGNMTAFDSPFVEDFNTLASTVGTGNVWQDNSTIPGWYATRTSGAIAYNSGTGSSNAGALYSFGVAGVNPVTDRALGSVGSGGTGTVFHAARLTNSTGGTITSLDVSYTGEQWRDGNNVAAHALTFQYQVANAGSITGANTPSSGWTTFSALSFTGPIATTTARALDGNAAANRMAISATLPVNVAPGQEIWLRWQDPDDSGNDHGLAIDDFSVTPHGVPGDNAPAVTGTTPANNATNVPLTSTILINFNESVHAGASAFAIACPTGTPQAFTATASPASSFTLSPVSPLPANTTCTVTVTATQITDADPNDPPDQMAADVTFSFTTGAAQPPVAANVIINEVDSDTPGTDTAEFVELYDGGAGFTPLDGLVLVFFNGTADTAYAAFDLDGYITDANGYFTIGNPNVPGVDLIFQPGGSGLLQNGADAVALYAGNATDFPVGAAATTANLQDAFVYGTDDPDDPGLLTLLNPGELQVNEGTSGTQSSQRCPNGTGGARNSSTYVLGTPSPDGANACPAPPQPSNSAVVISQLYGGGGNTSASYQNDYVELYNRTASPVDITGWSLQYASASGSGWSFTLQPLGGSIGPGEYLLIALASSGSDGAPLPPANINGLINMSGTSGKVALVNSFDALIGNCPIGNITIVDFVGYGGADCREGTSTAPSPSNTTALFRLAGGATDTDRNGNDFIVDIPAARRTAPIVELGPLVLASDPRPAGFNAPRDATIAITFTEPVDVIGVWFDIACASTGQHNSATTAGGGQQHFITPNVDFLAGEQCTVTLFKNQISDQDVDDAGPNTDNLPANYTWSFTVATGTAPPYPPTEHLAMGNPSSAASDTNQPDNYLMMKPEYALSYSRTLGRPNWVSWHLSDEWIGSLQRFDTFRPDPRIPPDWYRVQSFDFTNSGFDRGHMVPNADRDKETSVPINQATFLMTNMLAQAPDNNQGPWAAFENYLRTLLSSDEIYIVAGGMGTGGTGSDGGATTIANGNVTVPAFTWKVALVIPKGVGDADRVSCSSRTIAVVMPNMQGIRNDPWENYLTTVDAVESLTGYDFFTALPLAFQACVEAGINGVNPPLDTDAPTISCASPDGQWHAVDVTLACVASDGGSGLVNAADASFSLATSVAAGIEDANASTNGRVVCDVAGNCATAVVAGNKIDRKAPAILLNTPASGAIYQLNQVVNASYSCSDFGSGTATCAGTAANASAINTSTFGAKAFSVTATDAVGNASTVTVSYEIRRTLSATGPAAIWVGLKNSDAVGLRIDLRTEVLVNGAVVATGDVANIPTGSSGFNNAMLNLLNLALASGQVEVPANSQLSVRISARRTCSGGGHNSGTLRAWFNGQPIDSGAGRDAGSRIQLTIGGTTSSYFLRQLFGLEATSGSARTSVDATVNSSVACGARPYTVLGTWSTVVN